MLAYEEAQRYEAELVDVVEQRDRMEAQRDRARDIAVALEQELAALRDLDVTGSFVVTLARHGLGFAVRCGDGAEVAVANTQVWAWRIAAALNAYERLTDAQPSPGSSSDPGSEGRPGGVGPAVAHTGHPLPAVSPDCFVRKHDACTGEAWDSAADALVGCDCGCHEAAS